MPVDRLPRFALRLLGWFCPPQLYEGIAGDLLEQHEEEVGILGEGKASRRLLRRSLSFFRPGIILRNQFSMNLNATIMLRNYFVTGYRSILKRKLYAVINAVGLSVAIAFCVLIYLYVRDEKGFDQFHKNKDLIYRMHATNFNREKFEKSEKPPYSSFAYLPAALGERMLDELPEVEHMTRYQNWGEGTMTYKDKVLSQKYSYTDSGFFRMFSFKILAGSTEHIFENRSDAVLTPETVKKFFGDDDPIGKVFTLGEDTTYTMRVAAVIEAPPSNSSITFQMLVPMENQRWFARNHDNWGNYSYPTFVQLRPGTDLETFKMHIDTLTRKYAGQSFKEWREWSQIPDEYKVGEFNFMPLSDIHLNTDVSWEKNSDPKYSYILGGIALLIVLIACINYISLALTTSASRRIEVGVRKVAGAPKEQIVYQFSCESVLLAFMAMVLAIGLVLLFLPSFNDFTGKHITLDFPVVWRGLVMIIATSVILGIIAGSYPAFFLSRFLPAHVLKGGFTSRLQAGFTRPLVVVQFFLSACMIICSLVMYRQMRFLTTKELGFDKDHIIVVGTQEGWTERSDMVVEEFRNRLQDESGIVGVAGTSASFNKGWSRNGFKIKGENKSAFVYQVDPYYLPLLGIELKEGRNFDATRPSDSSALILNEAMVKDLGFESPIGEHVNWTEDSLSLGPEVIGVVNDYNFLSLEQKIEPMFLTLSGKSGHLMTMLIKTAGGDLDDRVETVKSAWMELFPDKPFNYTFVDDDVAAQYDVYQRWMKIMGLSTGLAILIACLGLFGLAGINAVNRTKEIGIRKVMGAGLRSIFVLLNRQYALLALIAFALAIPASWYGMTHWWLTDFQYHISVGWEIFAASVAGGLLLALLTVSYHGIKAALLNPAETLKHE